MAQRTLKRHEVDLNEPIDVFGLVRSEGLTLAFRPLPRLAGAYLPVDHGPSGVMINSNHPLAKQRYSAGHELGHHLMGHGGQFDVDTELDRPAGRLTIAEVEAEAFAGALLLPRQLIVNLLTEAGGNISNPRVCYQVSLMAGASYSATSTQAWVYGLVTNDQHARLMNTVPAKIKRDLAGVPQVAVGAGDVVELVPERLLATPVRPGDLLMVRDLGAGLPSLGPGLQFDSESARCGNRYHRVRVADRKPANPSESSEKSFVDTADGHRHPLTIELNRLGIAEDDVRQM